MIEIGRTNSLQVLREVPNGLRLGTDEHNILLPDRYVPPGLLPGDFVEVFVYTDSEDIPVATTLKPLAEIGDFACLKVVDVNRHGAFLDWGLPKDLFLPYARQHRPLRPGDLAVVGLKLHESTQRVIASTTLKGFFDDDVRHLSEGDDVELMVYAYNDLGALVIVEGRHAGLVFKDRIYRRVEYGEVLRGTITRIREDNRLDISLQRFGKAGNEDAEDVILRALHARGGELDLHDKSPPERIREELGLSKKAFKRAVGSLYRARSIVLVEGGLRLT
jgi:predicted RNA-binding protein (virulence factor B family)